MSESEGQRNESPLLSERGVTTISNTVVSQLAGMAAQEVEGVHMGGGATRTASGVLGSITGSEGKTSGISHWGQICVMARGGMLGESLTFSFPSCRAPWLSHRALSAAPQRRP